MTKMTNVMALTFVLDNFADQMPDDVREKVEKVLDSYANRKSYARKPTKTQQENEVLRDRVLEVLAGGDQMTASQVLAALPELGSSQKASALLKQLVDSGKVQKGTEGDKRSGKMLFWVEG